MKNKLKKTKLPILTAIIVMLTILLIAVYALAKYVTLTNDTAGAQVAKWSFKVNDSEQGAESFNLINTIDENSSVKEEMVAPGTSGHFDIKLDGSGSETAINYIINMNLENNPQNMHFYLDENYTVELPVEDGNIVINDYIPLNEINTPKNVVIYWNWPFETGNTEEEIFQNDIIDSQSKGKTITANVTVTGIQTKPDSPEASYTAYYYLENANDSNYSLYTSKTYSKNTDSDLTISNIAIDIPNAQYSYGSQTPNGEHISNIQISEDGTTNVYLYYKRERFTLTTIAGDNIQQVISTGISTGTSNSTTVTTNDGEKSFEQSQAKMVTKYKWGETITIKATEQNIDGYTNTFNKWNAEIVENTSNSSQIIQDSELAENLGSGFNKTNSTTTIIMPKQNIQITADATKSANNYTVVFNENTGEGVMEKQNFVYDKDQTLSPNTYTKSGYTFNGWNTKEDGTGTNFTNEQLVKNLVTTQNGSITLYAQWQPNEYIVVFDANGGSGSMDPQKFKYDELQALQTNSLTRDGYTFVEWNLAQDGSDLSYINGESILNLTELFELENVQNAEITLYAQWKANTYTVKFESNGGSGTTMANQTFTYEAEKALSANTYTKTGYTFAGWATSATGEVIYTNRQVVSNLVTTVNGTITLYAKWTKNSYTVVYNSNSPAETTTGTMENTTFTYDTTARLKENAYTRTGYTFKNWNTKPDGTGTTYENSVEVQNLTSTANGTVTLYAQWTANTYRINFNSNTGTGSMNAQICTYDIISNLTQNTYKKTGYTFDGWSTVQNSSEEKIYNDEQEIINLVSTNNGSITLYAQWKANTNTQYEVIHLLMNTEGIYMPVLTENLTGTSDSAIDLSNLVKTTSAYNVENGIYLNAVKIDGKTVVQASDIAENKENKTTENTLKKLQEKTTILKPDGTLQIYIYYARTYGYLTTAKSSYINSITQINNKKFYYGETLPEITATVEFRQGYLTNFEKWESNNASVIANITQNPIQNYTWPEMNSETQVTLTAKATQVESDQTPYTVNYYLENADNRSDTLDNTNCTLYSTKIYAGTTNSKITIHDIDIGLENCTVSSSNITSNTVITPDGNTIINVYYSRNEFELNLIGGENITEVELILSNGDIITTNSLEENNSQENKQTQLSTENAQNVENQNQISVKKTLKWGASIELNTTIENEEGYTYEYTGWKTTSTANFGTQYDATKKHTQIIMPAEDLSLTATASKTANPYKVVFNANSGTGTMATQTHTYNVAQNLTENGFIKTGYTFKGWATAETLQRLNNKEITAEEAVVYEDGEEIINLTTTANATINLYAIWLDETAPVIAITTESTTNSITVNVIATDLGSGLSGNYKYYIGTMQEVSVENTGNSGNSENIENPETTNQIVYETAIEKAGTTHIFEGLADNTTYYIKVEIADNAGNIGTLEDEEVATQELAGEVTFTDEYWTNGKYVLTVNTEATNENGETYEMQYQVLTAEEIEELKEKGVTEEQIAEGEGVQEEKWEGETISSGEILGNEQVDVAGNGISGNSRTGEEPGNSKTEENTATGANEKSVATLVLKDGDILYVRVYDGTNGADVYYSYEIRNLAEKTYTETELAKIGYGSSQYDILAYSTKTDGFEVDIEKEITGVETYNYYAKASSEDEYKLISTSTNWNDVADISNELLAKTTLNGEIQLKENETYKVKALARTANGTITQCVNTATIITQNKAELETMYSQNRTYIDSENYTAIIPAGFKVSSNTKENTISKGMVLKDGDGNEFVWVPVNQAKYIEGATALPTSSSKTTYYKPMAIEQSISNFYESIVYHYSSGKSYRNTSNTGIGKTSYREPSLLTGNENGGYTWNVLNVEGNQYDVASENYLDELGFSSAGEFGIYMNKEYTNMVNSVDNYGGFYISRYEVSTKEVATDNASGSNSNSNSGTTKLQIQSKSEQPPMSNLTWYEMYFNADSNRNANNAYYTNTSITSSMVWGSQYEAMLNWALNGADKSKLTATNIGNKTNKISTTGEYSNDVINNIYDLIANTYEWTQEAYSTTFRVFRGGSYNKTETSKNATSKGITINPQNLGSAFGTRVTLYINGTESEKVPNIEITNTTVTASTATINVKAQANGSSISKYLYSVSEDGENWITYESYSTEYMITQLSSNSTYYIKVQAQDNRGNLSIVVTKEIITDELLLEDGAIYVKSMIGSSGNGALVLGVRDDYESQGYYIEYQIVLGEDAITVGKTQDEENGIYTVFTNDGTWIQGDTITSLYENDRIYARLTDGTNITPYTTINIIGLETFSEIYTETAIYADPEGNTATIPAGFAVGTSNGINKINNGLVIQDKDGNQFVWVPVEDALYTGSTTSNLPYPTSISSTSTYKPMAIYQDNSTNYYQSLFYIFDASAKALSYVNTAYKIGNSSYTYREPSLVTGSGYDGYTWDLESLAEITGTGYDAYYYNIYLKFASATEYGKYKNEEYKNMIDSVEEYKGFYVGRYETSINNTTEKVAQSQSGKEVLNNGSQVKGGYSMIYYQDSNTNPSNPYYNSTSVTSSMIWNAQYNAMLNWILRTDNTEEKINNNKEKVFLTTLGNHKSATSADLSGTNYDDITNNIFDLGGNVKETTQGSVDISKYVIRGGSFGKNNLNPTAYFVSMSQIGYDSLANIGSSVNYVGSRMTLYIANQNDTTAPEISINGEPYGTTNSIYMKVNATDSIQQQDGTIAESSGIKKYHYYISTDGINYTEYIGWGNSYTFTGLTQGSTYYIKATVEDKAGNVSQETEVKMLTTSSIDAIDTILAPRIYGSEGNGHVYFAITSEYKAQGYYVEYQIGKNGAQCNINGTWTKSDSSTATGLSVGDVVYARINDGNGNITTYRTVTITQLEEFDNTLEAKATNKKEGVYYVYTDENGDTAYIPSRFSVGKTDSINKIANGLVVQDENGNEYVWVPVDKNSVVYDGRQVTTDGTDTYKPMVQYQAGYSETTEKQYFEMVKYTYDKTYETGSKLARVSNKIIQHTLGTNTYREPSLVTGAANYSWMFEASNNQYDAVSDYYNGICGFSSTQEMGQYMNEQYTEMIESIKTYGGFYIGRYETSLDSSKTEVQSKLNVTPMGSMKSEGNMWYGEYYKQDSVRNEDNPYYGSTSVVSSMIWGSQYNAMLNWCLTGNDAYMVYEVTGNHSGSKKATGAYGSDIINNIFDLCSNVYEWTQETYGNYSRVHRGGFYNVANAWDMSRNNNNYPTIEASSYGSRLALYIRSPKP